MMEAFRVYLRGLFTKHAAQGEVVFIQDPETGDYSAHFSGATETVGLGGTKKEALESLIRTTRYVQTLESLDEKDR